MKNSRLDATKIILRLLNEKQNLNILLSQAKLTTAEKPLVQEICYGVARWFFRLDKLAKHYLAKPLKEKDQDIYIVLLIGFYQLLFMRTPEHAAVMETVNVVKLLKKEWASGLINGILRKFLREKNSTLSRLEKNKFFAYAHPQWLLNIIEKTWGEHWQEILNANNQHPPLSLRVNLAKISRHEYAKKLSAANINFTEAALVESGIILEKAIDVTIIPGFAAGEVSVQDCAAQLAAALLNLQPGLRILDACAAPGGKTAHILESQKNLDVVALDIDPRRIEKISENLQRLHLHAQLKIANASKPETWWDGNLFDRILLDAPCSATGVIRRNPDIKILREPEDIIDVSELQIKLLNSLWPLLKNSGILVYATCSILMEENSQIIKDFLNNNQDAEEIIINAEWGLKMEFGRQILPGENNMDGFLFC